MGRMENKMETTVMGVFRVQGLGFRVGIYGLGFRVYSPPMMENQVKKNMEN